WEASGKDKDGNDYPDSYNAHAWYVGAIPQLSIATWVGNVTSESDPISDPNGDYTNVFGSNTSYPVWFSAMERVLEAKGDDDGWGAREWEGKVTVGSPITTDIEEVNGQYCGKNPADPRCSEQEEEEEEEEERCEDGGTGPECEDQGGGEGPGPGDGETTEPGDGESSEPGDDDNQPCGGFMQPPCEESSSPPDDESTEGPGNNDGR